MEITILVDKWSVFANPDFLPLLLPFDLTRGGTEFSFSRDTPMSKRKRFTRKTRFH